ncbi:MAG: hypothetical protein BGO69_05515 [Bacteroidetes bacterium 46-16]|nr:MAG: hypothetical protein BGO69_05515 [Bacteroidetes bacterium 46-16]
MKRELPVYNIQGTTFIVDVDQGLLAEKGNPNNVIYFSDLSDKDSHYEMLYDLRDKNWPPGIGPMDEQMINVRIPNRTDLDPEGMAIKYGLPIEAVKGKKDFDIMVDQQAYKERLNGKLVTIDIAGHTFYVDIRMDMLRPKDDFLSEGIVFSKIDHYYSDDQDRYIIPYNPKKHEFQDIDYEAITAIPKDLIVISFPHESKMDPIGWNRKIGLNETSDLKEANVHSHFEAKTIDWKETPIEQIIQKNLQRQQQLQQKKQGNQKQATNKKQRQGPKL